MGHNTTFANTTDDFSRTYVTCGHDSSSIIVNNKELDYNTQCSHNITNNSTPQLPS
jgi:hypothetical protein